MEVEGHRGEVGVLLDAFPVGQQPRIAGHGQQFLHGGPAFEGCHLGAVDRDQGLLGHKPWGVLLDVLGEFGLQVGNQRLPVGVRSVMVLMTVMEVGSAGAGGMARSWSLRGRCVLVFRAELAGRLGGLDLASAMSVLTACLADTSLGQTVRQRQARSTTSGQRAG